MPLFKKDDPPADPPAGDPPAGDEPKYVTVEQFETVSKTLDTVNESLKAMNANQQAYQAPAAPAAPVAPAEDPHKGSKERITVIDGELKALTQEAEDATLSGKGMGAVTAKQTALMIERGDLQTTIHTAASDPRIDAGLHTLDALSTEITSGKMEHLKLPEVKARYDHYVGAIPLEQRMNPEAKMGAYNLAVGENLAVIQDAQKQEWLRAAEEGGDPGTQDPAGGGPTSRQNPAGEGGIPTPDTILSPEAMRSIKTSRHRNPDNYYQSLGYEGWDDYFTKNKEYLVEEEEGQ